VSRARVVVFAYHDVGVRCLKTLICAGVEIALVVTIRDDPREAQWYASVAVTAADYGLTVIAPAEANSSELERAVSELQPDFIFSFYYRSMLGAPVLRAARRGALNMHGSLLPKYRGRAPVNWAILKGERETGATLHYMVERADAGDIVDQLSVPILQDDDAREVFAKVTVAAETILARSLPQLLAGTAARRPQPIVPGQYFGRREPEDGRIDWSRPALEIHNLVRAVAPPFPAAFAEVAGERWEIHRTRVSARRAPPGEGVRLFAADGECYVACADGGVLSLRAAANARGPIDLAALARQLTTPVPLS
jgi:methionyl-tRNA formyltransferase